MNQLLPNLLVVLGVCAATLGASAMHVPHPEAGARFEGLPKPLFGLGLGALAVGGLLVRRGRRPAASEDSDDSELSSYRDGLEGILHVVRALDDRRASLEAHELTTTIDRLLREDYFDLTSRSDDLIALIGFDRYAKVWDGIATAERLLSRCWSMATDGHLDEGVEELAHVRRALEQSAEALASL